MKLKPVPQGKGWLIAPPPMVLNRMLPAKANFGGSAYINRPNDHTIFKTPDGVWHLWVCIAMAPVGHLFCHYVAESLTQSPWEFTGEMIRADRNAGESLVVWQDEDFMQSPYVVKENGQWYMFFGGYATGLDPDGKPTIDYDSMENQICLLRSFDGKKWDRHNNGKGYSRVAVGPGAARDPCIVKFSDTWYIYYTGHINRDRYQEVIVVRTSKDLLNWSDWKIAHYVRPEYLGLKGTCNESPYVVQRGEYYYLFRSGTIDALGGYKGDGQGTVAVFRSKDPLDFGADGGDPVDKYVCNVDFHAPEIVVDDDGTEYISKIYDHERGNGIYLDRLVWEQA